MVFRFLILSDEVDDFKREIKIDSEATFLDLYNAILLGIQKIRCVLSSSVMMTGARIQKSHWLKWIPLLKWTII